MEPTAGFEPAAYGLRNHCSTTELRRQGDAFSIVAYATYATFRSQCAAAMASRLGGWRRFESGSLLEGTVSRMVALYQTRVTRDSVRAEPACTELADGSKQELRAGRSDRHAVSPPLHPATKPVPSPPKCSGRMARRACNQAISFLQDNRPNRLRTGWPKATGCSWMTVPYRKETYLALNLW